MRRTAKMRAGVVAVGLVVAVLVPLGTLTLASMAGPDRAGVSGQTTAAAPVETGSYLYRFVIIQAAPGRLLDLVDLYRTRVPVIRAAGDEVPYIVRHSQGDHWDLVVVYPSGTWSEYYSPERIRAREAAGAASGVPNAEFAKRFYSMVSWHEDIYVEGPPLDVFRAYVKDSGLAHFEMLQALAGKREALIEERKMENAYNRARGRAGTLIFVHDQGAAWDVITLDVFRNWRHFAEQETIPAEQNEAAARAAGFAGADAIGPYMRTLISTHRDTLGPPVALEVKK